MILLVDDEPGVLFTLSEVLTERGHKVVSARSGAEALAKFDDAVYVLHCFQKKMQKTSKADLYLAAQRYRDLLKELGQ